MYYLALVSAAPEGGYDFTCPDIPGFSAYSASANFSEAAAVAREVLAGHLAALIDNDGRLPPARDLAELHADEDYAEDFAEAVTTIMLPAIVPAGRSMRVNLSLDENTLRLIDASARDRALTRSAFVAEACRRFVTDAATPGIHPAMVFDTGAGAFGLGRIENIGIAGLGQTTDPFTKVMKITSTGIIKEGVISAGGGRIIETDVEGYPYPGLAGVGGNITFGSDRIAGDEPPRGQRRARRRKDA